MYMPTKKQWQTVIDNFYKILPLTLEQGNGHLDMSEPDVNYIKEQCGTIHCVGGWYAIATLDFENDFLDFTNGARSMAIDLGFGNKNYLEIWSNDNPKIWGNCFGGSMFYDKAAYDNAQSIEDVIHHLEGVRDRSPE